MARAAKLAVSRRAPAARPPEVLIVAHNHPRFFPGGAEIFAYDLFAALKRSGRCAPFFLAGATEDAAPPRDTSPFQAAPGTEDEMLFAAAKGFDYFYQSQAVPAFLHGDFRAFLEERQPDVIHFHHTLRVGLEALAVARQAAPRAKIVYTLHEYILICHHNGQMVRANDGGLCDRSSPARCHGCFPDIAPQQFLMRESFVKAHLRYVDRFLSPSRFLARRFAEWGLPEEKITVLENGRTLQKSSPFRKTGKNGKRNAFGYFGQINPYKGTLLALEAAEMLRAGGFHDFRLEISGDAGLQSGEFKRRFEELLERNRENATFHGKYGGADIPRLMERVDWVVAPSLWWENSPLVIQEAFMHRRPVICGGIGGMAEKVEDGVTGLHFTAGDAASLAAAMRRACESPALWEKLSANIGPRLSIEECAERHLELYGSL